MIQKDNTEKKVKIDSIKFAQIVVEEEKYLKSYISKKLYNFEDTEDAYQTTLMEAFRSKHNYRGDSTPRVWICGIGNNIAIRFNRVHVTNKAHVPVEEHIALIEEQASIYSDMGVYSGIEDSFRLDEMCTSIEAAISKLNVELKYVFTDAVINEESYQGVADKYEIPIGTVKSRIAKVREQLRSSLL